MIRTLSLKIVATAAGLVLGGTAVAAAVASPPEDADNGRATAEERTGFPVPVGPEVEVPEVEEPEVEVPEVEVPEVEVPDGDDDGGPVGNHGAAVSAVAKDDTLTGRDKGMAVSEVARSNAGKDDDGQGGPPEGRGRP